VGGLGFGLKWDMGWMHDTLEYFALDPIHRKFHHNQLIFLLELLLAKKTKNHLYFMLKQLLDKSLQT